MTAEGASVSSGVVVSQVHRPRWLLFGVIGSAVVVVLASTSIWYIHSMQTKATSASRSKQQSTAAAPTPAEQLSTAQKQLEQAQTMGEKATAYQQLGAAYLASGQASQALQSYQNALDNTTQTDTTSQTTIFFGEATAYYASHQYTQEIAVLQQAITLLKSSNDPYAEAKIEYAQNTIDTLQGAHQ